MRFHPPNLPQYRILGQIGEGQFGRVYCGIHRQTGQLVAIKDLSLKGFPTNQFLRELTCVLSLHHPNIVFCRGMQYHPRGRYLIMDYCEGGTLRNLIEAEGKLSLEYRLKLMIDLLCGLSYAQTQKVVHCDLKPENILLAVKGKGWQAKISDFGIARLQELGNTNVGRGYTGTPAYMAPERFYGKYSYESDIYAMGIIFYELLLGKRPFSGLPGELMVAHLNQRPQVPETIPPILHSILTTALEKLPQRRFPDAASMLLAVRQAAIALEKPDYVAYFSANRPIKRENELTIQHQIPLTLPVTHLAIDGNQVYLGMGKELWSQIHRDQQLTDDFPKQWRIILDYPIKKLSLLANGCGIVTKGSSSHSLYYIPKNLVNSPISAESLRLHTWQTRWLVSTLDLQGRWLAMVYQSSEASTSPLFQVYQLPQLSSVQSSCDCHFPAELITLDSRHGLASFIYYRNDDYKTKLKLFNRRGDLMDCSSLPFALQFLTLNSYCPYQLLGLDRHQIGHAFLIQLKPWKVTRLAVNLDISQIIPQSWGYLLADRRGNLELIDTQGKYLNSGQIKIEGMISAIAGFGTTRFLVATWNGKEGMLAQIDVSDWLNSLQKE